MKIYYDALSLCQTNRHTRYIILKSLNKRTFLLLPISIVLISLAILLVLRLPGIPYNARELFSGHNIFYYACFSMALLWTGISGAGIANLLENRTRRFLTLPLYVLGASAISFILLDISVTTESLHDILGSPVIYRDVTQKNAWGQIGVSIFQFLSAPALINHLELFVRYIAFYSPLVFFLVTINLAVNVHFRYDLVSMLKIMGVYLLYILPWIYLCKLVVIDFAATDNITELVDQSVFLGMGGTILLYVLVFMIAVGAVYLTHIGNVSGRIKLYILLLLLASVPCGWLLLNGGLAENITKYGITFSGVDFLLGPDRKHKLGDGELFLRWTLLQMAMTFIIAYSQWIVGGRKSLQ